MNAAIRETVERHSDPLEHRWGQRVPLEVPVEISAGGRHLGHGRLRNASISGALVETSLELPVFTNLVLTLPALGGCPSLPGDLAACVVRRDASGLAIEWRDMACARVNELLEKMSGRRVANLLDDPAFNPEKPPCVFA